jgi:2,4-dienoyl-CoA reductase-like NADH-dependent reductase (Old Yellow Enzyme family)
VDIPVIAVGGIRRLADIRDILDGGSADFVSMCRPLILEPDLVGKMQSGKAAESRCINCSICLLGVSEHPLRCYYGKAPR